MASSSNDASVADDGNNSGSVRAASCTSIEGTVETLVLYRSVFHEMLGEVEAKGNAVPNLQRQKSSLRDALSTAARSERASFRAIAKSQEEKSTDDQPLVVTLVLEATDEGPYQGQRFEYAMMSTAGGTLPQCITIGSDEDECQCMLDQDAEVSGEHAMISLSVDAGGMPVFCYTDTDSTNGSEVNAVAVAAWAWDSLRGLVGGSPKASAMRAARAAALS